MQPLQRYYRLPAVFLLLVLCLLSPVHSQNGLNTSFYYANLSQAFPQLESLNTPLERSPLAGGRNTTRCCLQAVSESYIMQDGQPIQNPDSSQDYIDFPPLNLSQSQFPCGASYDGDKNGAEPVVVPYSWCTKNCGGWEKSQNAVLSQWVQPFVGFILPAAVFCLNVPRKSMIGIWDGFFKDHFDELPGCLKEIVINLAFVLHAILTVFFKRRKLERLRNWIENGTREGEEGGTSKHGLWQLLIHLFRLWVIVNRSFLVMLFRASVAAGIALVNTIIWVAVVFSAAGPMILSGLYEASLDRRIIRSILHELKTEEKRARKNSENVEWNSQRDLNAERDVFYKRIHQLYAILVGNLQLPAKEEIHDEPDLPRSVWKDVYNLVKPPKRQWRIFAVPNPNEKKQESRTTEIRKKPVGTRADDDRIGSASSASDQAESEVDSQMVLGSAYRKITDTRLKGMLDCQASFGAAVGAPVVFFVGSFLFGVIQNLSAVGDNDTSHALAFGMWWMTIPHVAIVAGCLLAGNNPNTLEIIVSSDKGGPWEETDVRERKGIDRGKNKKLWIDELYFRYGASPTSKDTEGKGKHVAPGDKGEFHFNLWDWISLVNITVVLMVLPFVLAFLTSYYTPAVGLACRSLTFLLYFVFQICLGMIWLFDFFTTFAWTRHISWLPFGTYVEKEEYERRLRDEPRKGGEVAADETAKYEVSQCVVKTRHNAPTSMGVLLAFMFLGSMFTTVIGTLLQILGVYRNCLCSIPVSNWINGDYNLDISTNTAQAISLASKYWLPTGVASIVLMIVTCYIGWWYQRHWRHQFNNAVKALLEPKQHSELDLKVITGVDRLSKPVFPPMIRKVSQAVGLVGATGEG